MALKNYNKPVPTDANELFKTDEFDVHKKPIIMINHTSRLRRMKATLLAGSSMNRRCRAAAETKEGQICRGLDRLVECNSLRKAIEVVYATILPNVYLEGILQFNEGLFCSCNRYLDPME